MINAAGKKGGNPPGGSRHCRLRPLAVIAKSSLPPVRPFKKRRDPVISSGFSSAATAKAGKVKLSKFYILPKVFLLKPAAALDF